jgi:hypothetical protein
MKTTSGKKQRGLGLFQLLVGGLLLGFGGLAAFQVGKPYADVSVLKGISQKVLTESKREPTISEAEIARKILERANIQSIYLEPDGIHVKSTNPGEFTVQIDHITKIKLWKNAYFTLELSVNESSQ